LARNGQLIVPGQVAREFARNRATKLAELFQQIVRRANVPNLQKGKYPLLESVKEYQELVTIEREIDSKLSEYRTAIEKLKEHVRAWTWNDPVSLLYAELFSESVVLDPDFDQAQILEDLNFRQ
jgi:exonuclease VII small subunit